MHVVATVAARIHALSELSVRFQPDRFSSWPGSAEVDECRKECQRRVRQRRLQDPAPPLPCVSFVDTCSLASAAKALSATRALCDARGVWGESARASLADDVTDAGIGWRAGSAPGHEAEIHEARPVTYCYRLLSRPSVECSHAWMVDGARNSWTKSVTQWPKTIVTWKVALFWNKPLTLKRCLCSDQIIAAKQVYLMFKLADRKDISRENNYLIW